MRRRARPISPLFGHNSPLPTDSSSNRSCNDAFGRFFPLISCELVLRPILTQFDCELIPSTNSASNWSCDGAHNRFPLLGRNSPLLIDSSSNRSCNDALGRFFLPIGLELILYRFLLNLNVNRSPRPIRPPFYGAARNCTSVVSFHTRRFSTRSPVLLPVFRAAHL